MAPERVSAFSFLKIVHNFILLQALLGMGMTLGPSDNHTPISQF